MTGDFPHRDDCIQAEGLDFCRIFKGEMKSLYSLAFLLTADQSLAEECFAAALEDCLGSHYVFKEWAFSWCKRAIIKSAIRLLSPMAKGKSKLSLASGVLRTESKALLLEEVVKLRDFPRFVFILSILEGYTKKDCQLLLNRSRSEIDTARIEALQQLARTMGPRPVAALLGRDMRLVNAPSYVGEVAGSRPRQQLASETWPTQQALESAG